MDFVIIESKKDLQEYEQSLKSKGGAFSLEVQNLPKELPCLATYSFHSDINGRRIAIKHISIQELSKKIKKYL